MIFKIDNITHLKRLKNEFGKEIGSGPKKTTVTFTVCLGNIHNDKVIGMVTIDNDLAENATYNFLKNEVSKKIIKTLEVNEIE